VFQCLEYYNVGQHENIILVYKREDEQKIKQYVNDIKAQIGEDLV